MGSWMAPRLSSSLMLCIIFKATETVHELKRLNIFQRKLFQKSVALLPSLNEALKMNPCSSGLRHTHLGKHREADKLHGIRLKTLQVRHEQTCAATVCSCS